MIDQLELERILSSFRKTDPNAFRRLHELLLTTFTKIQEGLLTSNDFSQIKFLQGLGTFVSIFLSLTDKLLKVEHVENRSDTIL